MVFSYFLNSGTTSFGGAFGFFTYFSRVSFSTNLFCGGFGSTGSIPGSCGSSD